MGSSSTTTGVSMASTEAIVSSLRCTSPEVVGVPAEVVGQADRLQRGPGSRERLLGIGAEVPRAELDLVADATREDLPVGLLEAEPDQGGELGHPTAGRVPAVDERRGPPSAAADRRDGAPAWSCRCRWHR